MAVLAHAPGITELPYGFWHIVVFVIQRSRGQCRTLMGTPTAMPYFFVIPLATASGDSPDWSLADAAAHGDSLFKKYDVTWSPLLHIIFPRTMKIRKSLCDGIRIHTLKSFVYTFGYKKEYFESKKYFHNYFS